jgi:hypothetical protein
MRIHAANFQSFTPEKSLPQLGKISTTDMKDKEVDILNTEKLSQLKRNIPKYLNGGRG